MPPDDTSTEESVEDPKSLETQADKVRGAFRMAFPPPTGDSLSADFITDVYPDKVLIRSNQTRELTTRTYTTGSDGKITFGPAIPVTVDVKISPVTEAGPGFEGGFEGSPAEMTEEQIATAVFGADDELEEAFRQPKSKLNPGQGAKTAPGKAKKKVEFGTAYPAADYAYVPDPERPSTWRLRLTGLKPGVLDGRVIGAAIAALGPKGYRGNRVKIPAGDMAKVKAKVRAAWKKFHTELTADDMPAAIKEAAEPEELVEATAGSTILESLDDEAGHVWRVTMIRPGTSKNRRRYRKEVLAEAAHLYEGARAFDGHRDDATRRRSPVSGMVGWHENIDVAADGSLQSDFHIAENAEPLRKLFMSAYKANRPDLIGFSHDVSAVTAPALEAGARITDVTKIVEVHAVDTVADPSAGGKIERLVASTQEEPMTPEEIAAMLNGDPELAAATIKLLEAEPTTEGTTEEDKLDPTEATFEPGSLLQRAAIREALADSPLPAETQTELRESLAELTTEADIVARVAEAGSIWDTVLKATPANLPGQAPAVEVGADDLDKRRTALDAMIMGESEIDGIPAFRSVKEAYTAFTGRHPYSVGDEDFARWILAESVGAFPTADAARRLTESLTAGADWTSALGDSITRRLIKEYQSDEFGSWRQIVSDVNPVQDFRTQRRDRIGGYDVLPVVAEGGAYTALTSPSDEEASYAPTKKGGTEDYTLEMVANDDVGALRRIPQKLGRAAALTLYRAIWVTTIEGNAAIYDAVALFAAGHSNTTATTPLAEAGIEALRTKMVRQQIPGETSGFVGIRPRFLVVPPELYVEAFKLANSSSAVVGSAESATTPNPFRGLTVIEVPLFTDPNDWYLIADPNTVPTIEVGFYQGRQDPELLVQDQPAVGSVFSNDKITWKIRHVWGLTVLDYRGFQQATNV